MRVNWHDELRTDAQELHALYLSPEGNSMITGPLLQADVLADRVVVYFGNGEHVILTATQLRQMPTDSESEKAVRIFEEAQRETN